MSETAIVTACLNYLAYQKEIKAWRNNSGAAKIGKRFVKFGEAGSPDILCCYGGQLICIEVKTQKGRQTKTQKVWQKEIEEVGGVYWLVRGVDELQKRLEDFM